MELGFFAVVLKTFITINSLLARNRHTISDDCGHILVNNY